MYQFYVYILANKPYGTIYVGMTNDLIRRMQEHRSNLFDTFTSRYHVHMLVHYKACENIAAAIWREKRLKKWNRAWKIRLINEENPGWRDLYPEIAE